MEENTTTQQSSNNGMGKYVIPAAVVILIFIVIGAFYLNNSQNPETIMTPNTETQMQQGTETTENMSPYANGTYNADGNYVSPGGPRDVGVVVVLDNGVITDATFEGRATDAPSIRFQKEFADNYKSMVVGKNIDEVELTKVSGSSLTPKGFIDALEQIKTQAQSQS